MKIILPNKVYDVLKYICTIVLPAICAFIGVVFPAIGISSDITGIVLTVITATATLIGTLIGISSYQYNKSIAPVVPEENGNQNEGE